MIQNQLLHKYYEDMLIKNNTKEAFSLFLTFYDTSIKRKKKKKEKERKNE